MTLTKDIINAKGEKIDSIELPEPIFSTKASQALLHEVINAYLANKRRGTHSTKTKAEVSGGGHKPWKQKGTGRARSGSTRSPLWRHGGVIFGLKPRSYYQAVSSTKRRTALKAVLTDYAQNDRIKIIDAFQVSEPKTKQAADLVKKIGIIQKSIIVVDEISVMLARACRNISDFRLCRAKDLNAHNALLAQQLIFTKAGLQQMTERLQGPAQNETQTTKAEN